MSYAYLVLAFLLNAAGTILVKVHALRGFKLQGSLVELFTGNVFFLAALACFGLNLVAYSLALNKLPLSVSYPVMTVASFILVNGFSYYYFHEQISPFQVAGYTFILVGLFMVVYFAKNLNA